MTETTEEKDIIAAIERCIERDLGPAFDLSNGLHMSPGEAAVFHKWLNGVFDKLEDQIQDLKSQLSNREKEIKELKESADETLYYHEYPDNPYSDIFGVVHDWPTGAPGRVDSYSVITGPSTWCVRTHDSYQRFENEKEALEYSTSLQSKSKEVEE